MKKILCKLILIFLISYLFLPMKLTYSSTSFDKGSINFKRITTADGLSQTSSMYLYQDKEGYMWIGTSDGLNRYNGDTFKVYKYNRNDKNSISGNYISGIIEDNKGNLWIGTSMGLNRMNLKTGENKKYLIERGDNISNSNICEILIDSKDKVWIATANGLNIYNYEEDNFERILYSENEEESLDSQLVYSLVEDGVGRYWIGTDSGLNMYDPNTNKVYNYNNTKDSLYNTESIYKLVFDENNNNLWVCTIESGLIKIDLDNNKVEKFIHDAKNPKSIPSNTVNALVVDSENNIWVGTDSGLAKLESNGAFTVFKNKVYDSYSLTNNNVLSMCIDKTGIIWVGTYDGISIFNPNETFKNYKNNPFNSNSLSENILGGITVDSDGLLWIGTTHNGVNIIDRSKNKITRLECGENFLSSNAIRDIVSIDNEVWIATDNGLNMYDKNNGKIKTYFNSNEVNSLVSNDVRTLMVDNDGILWIGTKNGLCSFDRKGNFISYKEKMASSGISENIFTDIFQSSDDEIWIGSGLNGGLIRYSKKTDTFKSYLSNEDKEDTLSYNSVRTIAEDKEGTLWVGTSYGLNKLDRETETFIRYTEDNGLANNFIYGILIDENNNPWISTGYGLSKYDVKSNKFINYTVAEGLPGNEFNGYSYFKAEDGEMFFGTTNGLTTFYPKDLTKKSYTEDIILESIYILGENKLYDGTLNLSYKENQFQIEYFMPEYTNPKKVQYTYKLEGVDEDWIFAGNRRYANYINVPPGKYKFSVKARSTTGEWSNIKSIDIKINNPPWKSDVAYILYATIICLISYLYWNRVKILNKMVEQRTCELDKKLKENKQLYHKLIENEKYKNNYFVNLSHELRTPLNVILSTQQLITALNKNSQHIEKSKLNYYMDTLKRNSNRLLNLINNIIDTSKIESGHYRIEKKECDLVYLVEELVLSMKDFIEEKGIELIIDPEVEELMINCDVNDIERCVINLLGNATKFTKPGGKIEVRIVDKENTAQIIVSDTGVGIDEKYKIAIFNRFGQAYNEISEEHGGSGLGLTLTKQLLNLHGGEIYLESEVGKGSTFTIEIPKK